MSTRTPSSSCDTAVGPAASASLMERWDWGDVIIHGAWLDAQAVYRRYVDLMRLPWISIHYSRDPYPQSETVSRFVSDRMSGSDIWRFVDEQLLRMGCDARCADIDFHAIVRVKGGCKTLELKKCLSQKSEDYFLSVLITEKRKLVEIFQTLFKAWF